MARIYTVQPAQLSMNLKLTSNQQDCNKEPSYVQEDDDRIDVIDQEFRLHAEKSIKRFEFFNSI